MPRLHPLPLALLLALAVTPATAESSWTTEDLGNAATEAECVARAKTMFETFGRLYGHGGTVPGEWTVAGYDLTAAEYDGLVTCAFGPNGRTRATLVVHSDDGAPTEMRIRIAATLKHLWNTR